MASQLPDSSNSSIGTIHDELLEDLEVITEVDLDLLRDLLEDHPKEEKREDEDRNGTTSGMAQSLEVQDQFSWFNIMEMSPPSLVNEINWCANECMEEEMVGMVEYFGEDGIGGDDDSQLYHGVLSSDDIIDYGCSLW